MSVDKVLFLAEKLKVICMFSEPFMAKFTNHLAALHMLIQPLVYQVQYIFCVYLTGKHISLIQSTLEFLYQKFPSLKILKIGFKVLSTAYMIYKNFTIYNYTVSTCSQIFLKNENAQLQK